MASSTDVNFCTPSTAAAAAEEAQTTSCGEPRRLSVNLTGGVGGGQVVCTVGNHN